jgi:hypothetical protein
MPASLGIRSLHYGRALNWGAPLNRGLLSWYKVLPLGIRGSTWHDLTGHYPLAWTGLGPADATQGWAATRRLGGSGEVRLPGAASAGGSVGPFVELDGLSGVTVAVWAWQRQLDVIAYLWDTFLSTALPYWALETWNDGFLYAECSTTGAGINGALDYSTVVSAQTWFHLALVFDGSGATNADRWKLYINGAPQTLTYSGTIGSTWPAAGSQAVAVGRGVNPAATRWNGALDDWRIWQRALSAQEIDELYWSSRQGAVRELTWQVWPPAWSVAAPVTPGKAAPPRRQPWRFFRRAA